jgi:3-keto-5-aminohexanoate cleavage enzyme
MNKVIITAALTGSRMTRAATPYIPLTPEEIVQSAVECWNAGAAVVHIHVRDLVTGLGTQDVEIFKRVVEPLREKTDLVLCVTTSGIPGKNLPTEGRLGPLALKPELASFDAGSINLGGKVFINTPDFLDAAALQMKRSDVRPELEIFDEGMLVTCLRMREEGKLEDPLYFQFVLGTPWGAPGTPRSLLYLQEQIPPDANWSAIGVGKDHLPIAMMALLMGGHIRCGMEDSVYYSKGVLAEKNAQFVERIVRMANDYGRDVATPGEARAILKLRRP